MRFCLMLRLAGSMISGLEMEQAGSLGSVCRRDFFFSSCASRGLGVVMASGLDHHRLSDVLVHLLLLPVGS